MTLSMTSEFGRLREAIVHRPGRELARMTPSTRDYFLFDDLLFDEHAQQEHDWFTDLLQNHLGIKVHFFRQLLSESLTIAPQEERRALLSQVCRLESDMPPVEQRIGQLEVVGRWFQGRGWPQYPHDPEGDPKAAAPGAQPGSLTSLLSETRETGPFNGQEVPSFDYLQYRLQSWCDEDNIECLAEVLIEGIEARVAGESPSQRPGPQGNGSGNGRNTRIADDVDVLRRYVEGRLFYLTPLPNLMFMRDMGAVINSRLLLARMAAPGRTREPLLLDFVQRHHPLFKGSPRWIWADARINDPAWPVASSPLLHLEGGKVVQLRRDLIVLGVSQRTTLDAVPRVADV